MVNLERIILEEPIYQLILSGDVCDGDYLTSNMRFSETEFNKMLPVLHVALNASNFVDSMNEDGICGFRFFNFDDGEYHYFGEYGLNIPYHEFCGGAHEISIESCQYIDTTGCIFNVTGLKEAAKEAYQALAVRHPDKELVQLPEEMIY